MPRWQHVLSRLGVFLATAASFAASAVTLYPTYAEILHQGELESSSPGVQQQLLPLPVGANSQLGDLLSLTLPQGARQLLISTAPKVKRDWLGRLQDQSLQVMVAGQWQDGIARGRVAGQTLVIEVNGQLQLFPPDRWHLLRLPMTVLPDAQPLGDEPPAYVLHYENENQLTSRDYQLRLAYRGLQWQMRYQLQGEVIKGELVLNNTGDLPLASDSFTLVPSTPPRQVPMPAMASDSMAMERSSDVSASSELGLRQYQINLPLLLDAHQSQRLSLARHTLAGVEHSLLIQDWLFNRIGENYQPTRQLRMVWPQEAVALPGGEFQLLSEDGLRTLGASAMRPLEPGATQRLLLGPSSLISVEKRYIRQDRQSAEFELILTNRSQQVQTVEYLLQGVRQVDREQIPPAQGFRVTVELEPGERMVRKLQAWRAE